MLMVSLVACGKNNHTLNPKPPEKRPLPVKVDLEAELEGAYLAVLGAVNPSLTPRLNGAFTFYRDTKTDELIADVSLNHSGANVVHAQHVRKGYRCPMPTDDRNQDGVIDGAEGERVYGKELIPLDADLSTQASHDGVFPLSDAFGAYIYSKLTSFTTFLRDLRTSEDMDEYQKLAEDEALAIDQRVVVILGVSAELELPETTAPHARRSSHQALPIACGRIQKVWDSPGSDDDGVYVPEE